MEQEVKKKFYKKWWFWVIIVLIFFYLIGVNSKPTSPPQTPEINQTITPTAPVASVTPTPQTTQPSKPITKATPKNNTPTPVTQTIAPQPTPPVPASAPVVAATPVAPVAPAPFTISGNGQTASRQFSLQQGLAIFSMNYTGAGNFIVQLLDSNGNAIGYLVNRIGNYTGSQALQIPTTGSYLFNVQAGSVEQSGAWSIIVNQPIPSNTPSTTTFSGNGDQASQFFHLSEGLHTFNLSYTGGGNFIVGLLDQYGDQVQYLENVIGTFSGSTAVHIDTTGDYLLNIVAGSVTSGGNWNIQIQ